MKLPGGLPGLPGNETSTSSSKSGSDGGPQPNGGGHTGSMFTQFSKYVDTKNGTLNFAGKAVIHGQGIDFTGGSNFSISLDEVDTLEELGKGNYGTVYKVRHARPKIRRPGLGLAGNKAAAPMTPSPDKETEAEPLSVAKGASTTNIVMAMKEIHLELDEAKFAAIIMELDVLHRCLSPYIIDFYGAFFQEGAVYICIEFMDGGSIDKLYGDGIPENILRKITYATTQGLKTLKDEHNIIHRDVKPTNILVNTRGQVKICDFGVSGNLVASIAKTNIGCQSYMAPERISGGGVAQAGANPGGGTYSAQSDIWSLGLSIIECAMGRYPYPPETYDNIFSQLSVS
jgi:mitogen-activated protein kinase kinase